MKGLNRSKQLIITLMISFASFFIAYALSTEVSAQPEGKILFVAQGVDLESLNPYRHNVVTNYGVWQHIVEPLAAYDYDKRRFVGVLAESWTASGTQWTFKLRKNVKFHNGADFTASDVLFSLKRSMDSKLSFQITLRRVIKEINVIDRHTVTITTKKPIVSFLTFIDNTYILSEAARKEAGDEKQFEKRPIGTGPFKFVEWMRGERFVVEKNPNYWGRVPKIDRIVWKPIPEDAARVAALESGAADLIFNVPPHEAERLKRRQKVKVEEVASARIIFLLLDPGHKPLDNRLVRQAINHAIDSDAIIKHVLDGKGARLDQILGPNSFGYDPSLKPYSYDPKRAKELLAKAGYPDGFEIDFYTSTGRYIKDREVSQVIAAQLAKVGIKAKLQTPEWAVFNTLHRSGKCPLCFRGRGSVEDPDKFFHDYFETGVTKRVAYSNPKFDRLMQQQRQLFDQEQREPVLLSAIRLLFEDAVMVPLYRPMYVYGLSKRLTWKPSPHDAVYLADAELAGK